MINPEILRDYRWFRAHGVGGLVGHDAATCLSYARAEYAIEQSDYSFMWEEDPDGWPENGLCSCGCAKRIESCEGCYLYNMKTDKPHYEYALWGIWDADTSYRRIVQADLALQLLHDQPTIRDTWQRHDTNLTPLDYCLRSTKDGRAIEDTNGCSILRADARKIYNLLRSGWGYNCDPPYGEYRNGPARWDIEDAKKPNDIFYRVLLIHPDKGVTIGCTHVPVAAIHEVAEFLGWQNKF